MNNGLLLNKREALKTIMAGLMLALSQAVLLSIGTAVLAFIIGMISRIQDEHSILLHLTFLVATAVASATSATFILGLLLFTRTWALFLIF